MATTAAAAALRKPRLGFVRMRAPIQEQLRVEEALFRVDKSRNWFIYNEEKTPVTIVMGISGKPEQLLHLDSVKRCVLLHGDSNTHAPAATVAAL